MGNTLTCRPCSNRSAPPTRFPEELANGLAYDDGDSAPWYQRCGGDQSYGEYEEVVAGHSDWHVATMLDTHEEAIKNLRDAVGSHVCRHFSPL